MLRKTHLHFPFLNRSDDSFLLLLLVFFHFSQGSFQFSNLSELIMVNVFLYVVLLT